MVDVPYDAIADIPPAEVAEVELYHPKSWWTQYAPPGVDLTAFGERGWL